MLLCDKKFYHEGAQSTSRRCMKAKFVINLGVPLRVGLSVPSPRSFLAPGFPLQSLTQCGLGCELSLRGTQCRSNRLSYRYYFCHCEERSDEATPIISWRVGELVNWRVFFFVISSLHHFIISSLFLNCRGRGGMKQPFTNFLVFLDITIILTGRFVWKLCGCYREFIYLHSSTV